MTRSPRPRRTANLSDSIHRQLNMYALAASAAGVGVLALAQPIEAKIVYTPAHAKIGYIPYNFDLNHDGVVDFQIETGYSSNQYFHTQDVFAFAPVSQGNNKMAHAKSKNGKGLARALKPGVRIGPKQFNPQYSAGFMVWRSFRNGSFSTTGQWINVNNRYLGLAFQINGKIHYGWARLNVKVTNQNPPFDAVVTGYAYETIPNRPIIAGQTQGTDEGSGEQANASPPGEPTTLGPLAMGAPGLSIWRRKESALQGN